ncbi:MAG: glutaredoxin [Porticoccaceae bacterium]|nr:glutaredoxin [Porticoccaceae bacterium]
MSEKQGVSNSGNDPKTVWVEVLTASGCVRCQETKALAKVIIAELGNHSIQYREINVVDNIDYAVQLGVISAPAIALNGELVFPGPPSKAKLRQAILERLGEP